MKKKFSILLTLLSCVFFMFPQNVLASTPSTTSTKVCYEYLSDGSYFETTIDYSPSTRATMTGATKTTVYRSDSGQALWYVRVIADFTFNGSSATCTSSRVSAGSYVDSWRIINRYASKSGNPASATAVAAYYVNNSAIGSFTKTVTMHCDGNGNIS